MIAMQRVASRAFALALLSACPMQPGETRCGTFPVGNMMVTRCKTAPEAPPPSPAPVNPNNVGFWCSLREEGVDMCMRRVGDCEWARHSAGGTWSDCRYSPLAICAGNNCFWTAAGCSGYQRFNRLDERMCSVVQ